MKPNTAKSLIVGGALLAGIAAGAYVLTRNGDVTTGENNALLGATGDYSAGGGSSAMTDKTTTGNNSTADFINSILSGIINPTQTTTTYNQPSDEQAVTVQTAYGTSLYGTQYTQAKQVYDSYIANGKTVETTTLDGTTKTYTFGGYASMKDAIRAGDNDAIQAYGQAAVDAARAVYGSNYNNLTAAQQSALATNISHGTIDTADTSSFARSSLSELNSEDIYQSALNKTAAATFSTSSSSSKSNTPTQLNATARGYTSAIGYSTTGSTVSSADKAKSNAIASASQAKSVSGSRLGTSSDSAQHARTTGKYAH